MATNLKIVYDMFLKFCRVVSSVNWSTHLRPMFYLNGNYSDVFHIEYYVYVGANFHASLNQVTGTR